MESLLSKKKKSKTYQSDAISANTRIDESFYNSQKKYRLEWDPPTEGKADGYLKWYVNGEFLFGIKGENLNITGSSIPNEPMYLLMNTAVSSTWGFPIPCPEGCDCSCYECGNPDCDCSLPVGYCDMFPANFEIDYVRVWQAVDEPKHQLGCSTKDRPTELFIKGYKKRYMTDDDKDPLKPLQTGGAACVKHTECGGPNRGACSASGVCVCNDGFSGSACLSHFGFDDDPYFQTDNHLEVSMIILPHGFLRAFSVLILGFIVTFLYTAINRHGDSKNHKDEIELLQSQSIMNRQAAYQSTHVNRPIQEQEKAVSYCLIDGRMID